MLTKPFSSSTVCFRSRTSSTNAAIWSLPFSPWASPRASEFASAAARRRQKDRSEHGMSLLGPLQTSVQSSSLHSAPHAVWQDSRNFSLSLLLIRNMSFTHLLTPLRVVCKAYMTRWDLLVPQKLAVLMLLNYLIIRVDVPQISKGTNMPIGLPIRRNF